MTKEDILAIKSNPGGIFKIFDYRSNQYKYGWINELPSNPIDKETNGELLIASESVIVVAQKKKIKLLNGGFMLNLTGGYLLRLEQN